jgi:hypothetical protein
MTFRACRFLLYGVMAVGCAAFIDAARADDVSLLGGWNLNWDVSTQPTASPSATIQVQNATSSSNLIFNGYDLGLKFNRVSGSGAIKVHSASNPSSNSIVPDWLGPPTTGSASVANEAAGPIDYSVSNLPTSLVTMDFAPDGFDPSPGSVFEILSDYTLSDYVDQGGHATSYANNVNADYVLGTITVVPEPSSIVLLGVAVTGLAIAFARRK